MAKGSIGSRGQVYISDCYVKAAGTRELQLWVFQHGGLLKRDLQTWEKSHTNELVFCISFSFFSTICINPEMAVVQQECISFEA